MEGFMYQKGQRYPQLIGQDGVFLRIAGDGITLLCRFAGPTEEERKAFRAGGDVGISMGVCQNILFWTVKLPGLNMMDCTFCPQIEREEVELAEPEEGMGYAVTLLMADGETGELISIRLLGLAHDFSVELKRNLDHIKNRRVDYPKAIQKLYRNSTEQLEAMATAYCVMKGDNP